MQGYNGGNNSNILWSIGSGVNYAACKNLPVEAPDPVNLMITDNCSGGSQDCGGGTGRAYMNTQVVCGASGVAGATIYYSWETSAGEKGDNVGYSGAGGWATLWLPCYVYDYQVTITINYVDHPDYEYDSSQGCHEVVVDVTVP